MKIALDALLPSDAAVQLGPLADLWLADRPVKIPSPIPGTGTILAVLAAHGLLRACLPIPFQWVRRDKVQQGADRLPDGLHEAARGVQRLLHDWVPASDEFQLALHPDLAGLDISQMEIDPRSATTTLAAALFCAAHAIKPRADVFGTGHLTTYGVGAITELEKKIAFVRGLARPATLFVPSDNLAEATRAARGSEVTILPYGPTHHPKEALSAHIAALESFDDLTDFVGRRTELARLTYALRTGVGRIVVHGPPGVGTSELTERALRRIGGGRTVHRTTGAALATPASREVVANLITRPDVVVFVDNVEEGEEDRVATLPYISGATLLWTARKGLRGTDLDLRLAPWLRDEGVAYLRTSHRVCSDSELARLVSHFGTRPEILGWALRHLDRDGTTPDKIIKLAPEDLASEARYEHVLVAEIRALDKDLARCLYLLAHSAQATHPVFVARALGHPETDVKMWLEDLTKLALVHQTGQESYGLTPFLGEVVRRQPDAALFSSTHTAAVLSIAPKVRKDEGVVPEAAADWRRRHVAQARQALTRALEGGDFATAASILVQYAAALRRTEDLLYLHESLEKLRPFDKTVHCLALYNRYGLTLKQLGLRRRAMDVLEEALLAAASEPLWSYKIAANMALTQRVLDPAACVTLTEAAIQRAMQLPNPVMAWQCEWRQRVNLGMAELTLGKPAEALRTLVRVSEEIARMRLVDPKRLEGPFAETPLSLPAQEGSCLWRLGRNQEALEKMELGLKLLRTQNLPVDWVQLLLAQVLVDVNDLTRARESAASALAAAMESHREEREANALTALARAEFAGGDPRSALPRLRRASEILRRTESTSYLARTLGLWGRCLVTLGLTREAVPPLVEAEAIWRHINPDGVFPGRREAHATLAQLRGGG